MLIGFDGSRAFASWRTGTENYSYQLLINLAKIDLKNQYIVYLRSKKALLYLRPNSSVISLKRGIHKNMDPLRQLADRGDDKVNGDDNYGWPNNFTFKVINYPRLWTQVGLSLQTFTDTLDILFVPSHTLPLIRKPGLKTVMTVHDLGAEYLPAMHQLKQRLYLSFLTKFQLKSATRLIAVSKATKKDLIKRVGVSEEKIQVVYEGIDRNLFKPIKNDLLVNTLKAFDLKKNGYFLFVGTIQPRKNLRRLIEAFARLCHPERSEGYKLGLVQKLYPSALPQDDSIKLVLVGSKGWLSDEIYQLPKKLGIEDKVKFLGRVEDKDLPSLYSGAVALVYPSLFEGFGLPILEAQACGCPVITSNKSSMPEVAGEGAIFVDPYKTEEITEAMKKVMEDDRLRAGLAVKGYKNIKKFSWEKCAKETLEVFKKVSS